MNVSALMAYWCRAFVTRTVLIGTALLLAGAPLTRAQQVTLDIGSGTGVPGGTVAITVSLSGAEGLNVSAAQVDVLFDPTALSFSNIDPTSHQIADCVADPRLSALTHSASIVTNPPPPSGQSRLQLGIVSTTFPLQTFGDGELFTCTFQIDSGVTAASLALTGDRPLVTDNQLANVPAVATSGTITLVPCASDADCPPTKLCLDQVCEPGGPCTTSADCPDGRPCVDGTCSQFATPTPTPTPKACTIDTDCLPGQICVDGVCTVVQCTTTADCPSGVCVDNVCTAPTPAPTPTNTPLPSSTPTNTRLPNTATPTNTAPPPTPTPTPTVQLTATPTRTNTAPPPTATPTSAPGGAAEDDGCSISQSGSGASLLWLLIPAAVMVWRRRR